MNVTFGKFCLNEKLKILLTGRNWRKPVSSAAKPTQDIAIVDWLQNTYMKSSVL
jgi:hypothetical protein